MFFELTDSLCADIVFAMENQQQDFVLDAENLRIVQCAPELVDEENFYSLPSWTSGDGYALLEDFVSCYKGIKASGELKQILLEGRGVFRNFKNTLKNWKDTPKDADVSDSVITTKRNTWTGVRKETLPDGTKVYNTDQGYFNLYFDGGPGEKMSEDELKKHGWKGK